MKSLVINSILVSLMAIFVSGCKDDAPPKVEIRPVRTIVVEPKPIDDDRQAIGEIQPRYETNLGFQVAGKLVSRLVDVGVQVKKGDLLARLDDQDFNTKVSSGQADVTSAEAVLAEAVSAEQRAKKLSDKGVTSIATYDAALRSLRTAQAKLSSAKSALILANDQLKYTRLLAEYDGIVTGIGAEPGQVISTGQMVVKLAKPDDKDAIFNIAETAFRDSKPNDHPEIIVSLLSNPNIKVDGVSREISPVADPTTRTYQVKVTLKNPPHQIRFGASVLGQLKGVTAPVVVLPTSALFDKNSKSAVWVFDKTTSQVNLKQVTISRYDEDRIIVNKGLAKGDVVVTAGVNRLHENQKVRLLSGAAQ